MSDGAAEVAQQLVETGWALVPRVSDRLAYLQLATSLGTVVGEERIALRPGAHAYVAKPGSVPLHTDQPEVDVIGWRCEAQDRADGANLLLDARPVVESLSDEERLLLCDLDLRCPPLEGGPPELGFPVLRRRGSGWALFCSPWLRPVVSTPLHDAALDVLRTRLSHAAKHHVVAVRLEPGDVLFVDNGRVLHGRGPIAVDSPRRLQRVWIRSSDEARYGPRRRAAPPRWNSGANLPSHRAGFR